MTRLVVLQPSYLPWIGYFDQMAKADIFLHYDTVGFDKNGWRNRNRVLGPNGPVWLTVPTGAHSGQPLNSVLVSADRRWRVKQLKTIRQCYASSDHLSELLARIEPCLMKEGEVPLVELNLELADALRQVLGIETPTRRVSEFQVSGDANQRLVALCQQVGATQYLSGNAAKNYLDEELFRAHNISVEWHDYEHPVYAQKCRSARLTEFVPYLSVVDLILNCGVSSRRYLR